MNVPITIRTRRPAFLTALAALLALGLLTPSGSSARQSAVVAASGSLVAAYGFEETGGSAVVDASGNGNNGVISGAGRVSEGRFGSALSFDGAADWVTVADAPSLDLTAAMTLSAWVRPTVSTGWRTVILKERVGGLDYALYASSFTSNPAGIIWIGAEAEARGGTQLPPNQWSYLATTYDGSTLRLYVNGDLTLARAATGVMAPSAGPLRIGGNDVWSEWFSGAIDEVRVYSRALSGDEINADMQTAVGVPPEDPVPPGTPGGFATTASSETSISTRWSAPSEGAVAGYGVYRDGTLLAEVDASVTSFTFSELDCGRRYTLAVDAFDGQGRRSAPASAEASTADCAVPPPPGAPGAFATTASTETSISTVWSAPEDGAVTGYGLYRDGTLIADVGTSVTSFTFLNLDCGRRYALAVDAFDARGRRSPPASLEASTADCQTPFADLFVATDGADTNPCTRAAPCRSFDRAYRAARPGQVVEVAAGTYPPQAIGTDVTKTTAEHVVFQPAPGAEVTLGCNAAGVNCLSVNGRHITVRGIRAADLAPKGGWPNQGSVSIGRGAVDVTYEDLDVGSIWIGGHRVTIRGGDYGPAVDHNTKITDAGIAGRAFPPSDVLIEGVRFHDYRRYADHQECISLDGGDRVTIRNSTFDTCAVFAIFSTPEVGGFIRDVTIENNVFSNSGRVGMASMVKISTHGGFCERVVVRYNTIADDDLLFECGGAGHVVEGNIFTAGTYGGCGFATWRYNVFATATSCGTDAVRVSDVRFVDAARGDFHLAAGSPAVDAGNPASYPADDIDGETRPSGAAPDAGADERP